VLMQAVYELESSVPAPRRCAGRVVGPHGMIERCGRPAEDGETYCAPCARRHPRILANDGEEGEQDDPDAAHLPPGWGMALMTVYDPEDLVDADLRQCWPATREEDEDNA